jgi:hypothetical protein
VTFPQHPVPVVNSLAGTESGLVPPPEPKTKRKAAPALELPLIWG